MKKNFFALVIAFACLTNSVAAKDVWISSDGNGSAWYVVDETVEGSDTGKFRWTNADTKLVDADGSFKIVRWNFTQTSPDGGRFDNWVYEIVYPDGTRHNAEVLAGTNAEKILRHCLNHLNM